MAKMVRSVVALAGVALLLGFGAAMARAAAPTTIRVWAPWPYYSNVFAELISLFRKSHPDINVQYSGMQESDYRPAVKSALAAKTGPDTITAVPGRTGMNFFANAGDLVDLTPYYKKYNWTAKYPEWILKDLTYTTTSGHSGMWVLPTHIATLFLFYDPQLFAKHGWKVPTSLDDFLGYCKTAHAAGLIPLSFGNGSGGWMAVEYISYLLNQTAGDSGVNALVAGKSSWTAPDVVKGVDTLVQLQKAGCFEPGVDSLTEQSTLALWMAGKAGMTYDGDWVFGVIKKQDPALYTRMKLLPGQKIAADAPWKPTSALGDSIAVTTYSKHKDAAVAWLDFMASKPAQLIWMHDAGRVVAWTALNTKENGASPAQIEDVKLLDAGSAVDLDYPLWPETYNALEKALQNVLNGSQSPAAAMATVQGVDQQQWQRSR